MNHDSENPTVGGEAPSFEPWLRVCALACVPMGAALALPKFAMPLMAATVLLVGVAVAMLVRQERGKRRPQ